MAVACAVGVIAGSAGARGGGGTGTSSCMGTTDPSDAGTITWSPAVVWPPNHKLVPIKISWTEDSSGPTDSDTNTLTANQVTSVGADGPGSGSGQPTSKQGPDYSGIPATGSAPDGSAATVTVYVRAERAGTDKAGRTYTISGSCQSGSEPSGTWMAVVTVPHDMGNNTSSSGSTSSKHSGSQAHVRALSALNNGL